MTLRKEESLDQRADNHLHFRSSYDGQDMKRGRKGIKVEQTGRQRK